MRPRDPGRAPAGAAPTSGARGQASAGGGARRDDEPVIPERSADDGDAGWGERVEDDDERWYADRPPHWG